MLNQIPVVVSVIVKGGMVAETFANQGGVQVRVYDYDALAVGGEPDEDEVYNAEISRHTPHETIAVGTPLVTPSAASLDASLVFVGMVNLLNDKYRHLVSSTVITYHEFVLALGRLSAHLANTADLLINRDDTGQAHRLSFTDQCCTYRSNDYAAFIGSICYGQFSNMDWVMLVGAGTIPDWLDGAISDWLDAQRISKK